MAGKGDRGEGRAPESCGGGRGEGGGGAGAPQRSLVVSAQAEHARPLPNPPLEEAAEGSEGGSHHPQGEGEPGLRRVGSGADSD